MFYYCCLSRVYPRIVFLNRASRSAGVFAPQNAAPPADVPVWPKAGRTDGGNGFSDTLPAVQYEIVYRPGH